MSDNELLYLLALQHIPKIGDITAKKLIHYCGSPEAVLKEKRDTLVKIEGIGSLKLNSIQPSSHLKAAEIELNYIRNNNISCWYFMDEDYPERLKHCIDGPILLFKSGAINLKDQRVLSIVGTRKITNKGIAFCQKLVEDLKPFKPVIVSGFAYGTDITAQKAAMGLGLQTIGCLAHGLNQIYPKSHKRYVAEIEKNGGFLTDFWSSDDFDRNNFLKRNRVIAGLSEATVVIESGEKGGSLVTADIANSYDREVFAVPGKPSDNQSIGCNNLIKQHKAHLLSETMDVPFILNWHMDSEQKKPIQKELFLELDDRESRVYNYLMEHDKTLLDVIAIECQIPIHRLTPMLLKMELQGIVRPLPGKLFELV